MSLPPFEIPPGSSLKPTGLLVADPGPLDSQVGEMTGRLPDAPNSGARSIPLLLEQCTPRQTAEPGTLSPNKPSLARHRQRPTLCNGNASPRTFQPLLNG